MRSETLTLITPDGTVTCPVEMQAGETTFHHDNETRICLTYDGKTYESIQLTKAAVNLEEAFADLQKQLPPKVHIASCLTCRHGNFCPYGGAPDVLYCTKELNIGSKLDLVDLIDREKHFVKRAVSAFSYCDSFACQSADAYTYNDFLFYLTGQQSGMDGESE